jgi:hypothetical protein
MRFLFIVWIWELKSKSKTKRSVLEKKSVDIFEIFQIATTCCSSVDRDLGKVGTKREEAGWREREVQFVKQKARDKRHNKPQTTDLKDNIEWRGWALIDGTRMEIT